MIIIFTRWGDWQCHLTNDMGGRHTFKPICQKEIQIQTPRPEDITISGNRTFTPVVHNRHYCIDYDINYEGSDTIQQLGDSSSIEACR